MNVSIAGKEGAASSSPSAIRDPQPELAQPDRPVWVLAGDLSAPGLLRTRAAGRTSNQKTYDFGPLKPGETAEGSGS